MTCQPLLSRNSQAVKTRSMVARCSATVLNATRKPSDGAPVRKMNRNG
jgi:hypothetical protein